MHLSDFIASLIQNQLGSIPFDCRIGFTAPRRQSPRRAVRFVLKCESHSVQRRPSFTEHGSSDAPVAGSCRRRRTAAAERAESAAALCRSVKPDAPAPRRPCALIDLHKPAHRSGIYEYERAEWVNTRVFTCRAAPADQVARQPGRISPRQAQNSPGAYSACKHVLDKLP